MVCTFEYPEDEGEDASPESLTQSEVIKKRLLRQIWTNYKFRTQLGSLTLFKLPDSALYFLSHFDRILSDTFVPSCEDIIRMRRATTGIQVQSGMIL